MFIDSANIEAINHALKSGVIRGVTTNPTILLKEKKARMDQIKCILETEAPMLYVQLVGDSKAAQIEDYKNLKAIQTEKILGYKVALDFTGLEVIQFIRKDNPEALILGTAIYAAEQGIMGAMAGCTSLAPYVNRMQVNGIDPYEAIERMRQFIDARGLNCEIVAASFKSSAQVLEALKAGAHTATLSPEVLMQMIEKDLAAAGIRQFESDHEALVALTR